MCPPGCAAHLVTASLSLLGAIAAQTTAVLPATAAAVEQPASLTVPWNGALPQSQTIYRAAMFTAQGIDHPITITALRWRAEGGHHHSTTTSLQATIALASTRNAVPLWLWADNRGDDFTSVFAGPVTLGLATGTSPNQWAVAAAIAPFVYDPSTGRNLLVEVTTNGTAVLPVDASPGGGGGTLHAPTANAPGATTFAPTVPVVELTYAPTFPLLARFVANTTAGPAPLQVTFTDRSFCADPAGVQTWRWDLDGDGLVDSTLQNPTFTYASCGDHNVTLAVTDAHNRTHVSAPLVVSVDPFTASFSTGTAFGPAPLTLTFTDTSTPPAASLAWDFDADGLVDSTAANPTWTFAAGQHEVRLVAQRGCRTQTTTAFVGAGRTLLGPTLLPATGNHSGLFLMDFQVHAADGIELLGFHTAMPGCCSPGARLWVLVSAEPHATVATDPSRWRIGTSGTAMADPTVYHNRVVFDRPLHLAPGTFGIALGFTGPLGSDTTLVHTANTTPYGNGDVTVQPGLFQYAPFVGGAPRGLNGHFFYTRSVADQTGGFGFFAEGCPSSAGVARLHSLDGRGPRLGRTLTTTIDAVPAASPGLFAITGLDRTTTVSGPLPLDLAPFGMPGCELHVRDDVVTFHGAASSFTLSIPNAPYLVGLPFYQQALLLDPTLNNAARAAISDAAAAVVGL